jgi:hypothetical protein
MNGLEVERIDRNPYVYHNPGEESLTQKNRGFLPVSKQTEAPRTGGTLF